MCLFGGTTRLRHDRETMSLQLTSKHFKLYTTNVDKICIIIIIIKVDFTKTWKKLSY